MQEGLEEKIRSVGHWRVNIRPTRPVEKKLLLGQAAEVVEKSRVSIRGWDYPHVDRGTDYGGHGHVGEYVENWCDWHGHVEFWRMYRSTQFLHYRALWEDTEQNLPNKPHGTVLSVLGAIYSVTEMVEFTSRLFHQGLYQSGANLNVTLGNTKGRQLWVTGLRMPFISEKKTQADAITIERAISTETLKESPRKSSLDMLLELFDHFGWNPDPSIIQNDQTRFYNKQF
jgi:hypothetical protein